MAVPPLPVHLQTTCNSNPIHHHCSITAAHRRRCSLTRIDHLAIASVLLWTPHHRHTKPQKPAPSILITQPSHPVVPSRCNQAGVDPFIQHLRPPIDAVVLRDQRPPL
ncbi:hypothetical protein M0R45_036981 [Rubus argutus]|uniref:Uncharacterized protein n=1 Tax=Rubus argutus TaxID=59490 RepID=A0AAW1VYJ2_RUBAR